MLRWLEDGHLADRERWIQRRRLTAGDRFSQEARSNGGLTRAKRLSPERREQIARLAALTRWRLYQ